MDISVANIDIIIGSGVTAEEVEDNVTTDLIFLNAAKVRLFRTGGATVRVTIDDPDLRIEQSYLRAQVARAFPLSKPDTYIGLRDGSDKDIGMLVTLDGLDKDSRAIITEELERRYFVPRVGRIIDLKEDFGNYTFEVDTDRGERRFIVQNLRDSVQELSPGRVLLTDKDGTRYEVPSVSRLDPRHQAIFARAL